MSTFPSIPSCSPSPRRWPSPLAIALGPAQALVGPARLRRLRACRRCMALHVWWHFGAAAKEAHGYAFLTQLLDRASTGSGIGLKLGLNGISLPLFVLAGLVGLAAGLYAIQSEAERLKIYLMLLLVMQAGLMGDVRERGHLLLLLLPRAGADPDLHHGRDLGRARPQLRGDDDDDLPDAGGDALPPGPDRHLREERGGQLRPHGAARHARLEAARRGRRRSTSSASSSSASGSWSPSGRSTPGRPWATARRRARRRCCTRAS